ncbi:MAG: hypothetical protein AB1611_09900 [bacterium]
MHNRTSHTHTLIIAGRILLPGMVLCLLLFTLPLRAQGAVEPEVKFTSSLNPVGSGARALGMGGAFIAFADDATAASWNPAGLKNLLRPEMSIVGQYDNRRESFSFSDSPGASNEYGISSEYLNYLSLAYPFRWQDRNFVFSLNYQNLYSLNRKMNYQWQDENPQGASSMTYEVTYRQEGSLKAASPAIAAFLTRTVSLGLTLNFWSDKFGDNGWVEDYRKSGKGIKRGEKCESTEEFKDRYSFSGFNTNIGLLWDIRPSVTLGAVVKTPFTARLRHEGKSLNHTINPDTPLQDNPVYSPPSTDEQKLSMPLSYGLGLAVRPSDRLIFDLDLARTEWNGYVLRDAEGRKIDPVTCKPKEQSSIKPTHQVRLGGEYVFLLKKTTFSSRFGLFYDPEPAAKNPDDFSGFSLGLGMLLGRLAPVSFDVAYQYRVGRNVEGDSIKGQNSPADVKQHLFYYSAIFYF